MIRALLIRADLAWSLWLRKRARQSMPALYRFLERSQAARKGRHRRRK